VYNPGDPAPDLMLEDLNGSKVNLSDIWGQGNNALLIFLRHLG
jgi:peroxiredoxin